MLNGNGPNRVGENWYVVATWPGGEYRARDWLERRGYAGRLWLPEKLVRRQTRRKILVSLKLPLFPGYLFVAIDTSREAWHRIGEAPTVHGLLAIDGILLALPQREVVELRRRLNGRPLELTCRFTEHQPVRITDGVFAGHVGTVLQQVGECVKILLDFLGRATETLVPEALVEPA